MNSQLLYVKKFKGLGEWEYKDSKIYFCESCRQVYRREEDANKCCVCYICKDPVLSYQGKNDSRDKNGLAAYHGCCWDKNQKEVRIKIEKEDFDKAQKLDIKDYKGYLLSGECASDDFAGYFDDYFDNHDFACPLCQGETEPKTCVSSDDKNAYLSCKSCAWNSPSYEVIEEIFYIFAPEYIWATDFKPVRIDIDSILENIAENHHESVSDYMKGVKDLEIAIDKWNELNKDIGSYNESSSLALINIKEFVKELYNK